jgi:hypothetical protein
MRRDFRKTANAKEGDAGRLELKNLLRQIEKDYSHHQGHKNFGPGVVTLHRHDGFSATHSVLSISILAMMYVPIEATAR